METASLENVRNTCLILETTALLCQLQLTVRNLKDYNKTHRRQSQQNITTDSFSILIREILKIWNMYGRL